MGGAIETSLSLYGNYLFIYIYIFYIIYILYSLVSKYAYIYFFYLFISSLYLVMISDDYEPIGRIFKNQPVEWDGVGDLFMVQLVKYHEARLDLASIYTSFFSGVFSIKKLMDFPAMITRGLRSFRRVDVDNQLLTGIISRLRF